MDSIFLNYINEFSSFHLFFRSLQEKTSKNGYVEEARERGSGWIEEEETPPAKPAPCALTAVLWVVFHRMGAVARTD